MKLSSAQKEFLQSIFAEDLLDNYWECSKEEMRTARKLEKEKLVEFEVNQSKADDISFVRLTKKGRWVCIEKKVCECGVIMCPTCNTCCNPNCEN